MLPQPYVVLTMHVSRARDRGGVAATEFAICLPIIIVLAFGSIEACSMIYMKQAATIAAYEGARTANAIGATTSDVEATCNQIFTDRGLSGAVIATTPSEVSLATPGSYIVVQCTIPNKGNSVLSASTFSSAHFVEGRAEFMKKY